ncbi:MAG: FxsA family protein [Hyphomicrobiales bacterium]
MLKLLPFFLLVVPMAEIAVFVVVGSKIGVAATLALIVVTAIIGSILLRLQGFALLARIRDEVAANRLPGAELGHGVMLLIAGLLLLTPGFVTDTIGFLLFVPPVRDAIWRWFRDRLDVEVIRPHGGPAAGFGSPRDPFGRGNVVDLDDDEFFREPPAGKGGSAARAGSPWSDRPERLQ